MSDEIASANLEDGKEKARVPHDHFHGREEEDAFASGLRWVRMDFKMGCHRCRSRGGYDFAATIDSVESR